MTDTVPPWLATMRAISGTLETPGAADNPTILKWRDEIARRYPDMAAYCREYTHDEIPWCGLTVAYCMAANGIRPVFGSTATQRFLWAAAWAKFGTKLAKPKLGCIMVFTRDGGGHVSLYEGEDATHYIVRGGNQSDAVNVMRYPKSRFTAAVWPDVNVSTQPQPKPIGDLFEQKSPKVMSDLIRDFGFTDIQAAGILGNIGHECAGFTTLQEVNPLGGGLGGYGWCQWTGIRRSQFFAWCEDHDLSVDSDAGNYGFLKHELTNTSERKAVAAVKATKTLVSATQAFEQSYERAGVKHYESRIKYAERALAAYRRVIGTGAPPPAPKPTPIPTPKPTPSPTKQVGIFAAIWAFISGLLAWLDAHPVLTVLIGMAIAAAVIVAIEVYRRSHD